jgi:crossover junction endodeoxyribonuclease RuvC
MVYAGIDPGQKGGISLVEVHHGLVSVIECWAMPDSHKKLREIFEKIKEYKAVCIIEKSQPMPKQGVTSTFTYGMGYGVMLGLMIAFEIPYHEIRPAIWKKEIMAGEKDKKDKKVAIKVCERMFPEANLLPTERSKVPSDGMAESCLIADYGRRKNL